jgi:two-component system, sensor histidine kinase PdtaS
MSAAAGAHSTVGSDLKKLEPLLRPKRRWEAADTVIAGSAALIAIIVAIFVLLCVQSYGSIIEETKDRGQRAASAVAEGTRWVVSSALVILDGVAASLDHSAATAGGETLAAFEVVASAIPARFELGVYDVGGNAVAAASSPAMPPAIADKDYFRAIVEGADWSLGSQDENAATGEATFSVAKRLVNNGAFAGVIIVAIGGDVLNRLAEPQGLGPGSTVSLIRADGWVIARDPSLSAPLDLSGTAAFGNLNAGETGSYLSQVSPADGVARIVSFRHVGDLGYIALASIALDTALAELWRGIWTVSLLIAPIAIALLVGSFITARLLRRTQSTSRSLAAALEHNEILFREIHHRVKNNLQSVNSLLQLQPIPPAVKANMSQRIAAMSAVHEHIYRSETFSTVRVKDYLHTLIENVRAGYDPEIKVVEEIEDVAVDKDAATPLALIVNEVVSNCFKHAFADGRAGTVTISLVAEGEGHAKLRVRDNGVGFDPAAPGKGIGRRLIDGFAAQLQGEVHQTSGDGSEFALTFPLAKSSHG